MSKLYGPVPRAQTIDVNTRRCCVFVVVFRQSGALSACVVQTLHDIIINAAVRHPQEKDPILAPVSAHPTSHLRSYLAILLVLVPAIFTALTLEFCPVVMVLVPMIFYLLDQRFAVFERDITS